MAGNTTILAAIQDILQAMSRFQTDHVTIGDTRALGADAGPWAILYPGPVDSEQAGDWSQFQNTWTDYIELWRPFAGDDLTDIVADLDDVLGTLYAYPTLNGTANVTLQPPIRVSELQWLRRAGDPVTVKPRLVGYRLTMRVMEDTANLSTGEFA